MLPSTIAPAQRYMRGRPCPICGGWDNQRRGKGERCSGYLSADGHYAYCTREEYGGALAPNPRTSPLAWAHRLCGPCKCGVTHAPALEGPDRAAPSTAKTGKRSGRPAKTPAKTPRPIRPDVRDVPATPSTPSTPSTPATETETETETETPRGETVERQTAIYDYRDAAGVLAYQVVRYDTIDTATGERIGKRFVQRRRDPAQRRGWVYSLGDTPRVLYRLPAILAADPARTVYVCEGEKCADALDAAGLLATTAAGGAGNWRHTADAARAALAGRHVVILPDNDAVKPDQPHESCKGQRHAVDVAQSLADVAASVRVLMLPDLDAKGDVYDWLTDGHAAGDLETLAAAAPVWTLDAAPAIVPDWGALDGETAPDRSGDRPNGRGPRHSDVGSGAPRPGGDVRRIPGTRWYLSPDRTQILEATRETEEDDAAGILAGYRPVYDWTIDAVHAIIKFPADEAPAGRQVYFDVEIDSQRERIAYGESDKGDCWERWGTLGIAGRSAVSSMHATIQYLARISGAPTYPGTRHTGWTIRGERHALVLPNGALIGREGVIPQERAYLAIAARHAAPYPDILPASESIAAQSAALDFLAGASERSLASLVLCAHLRSILYGVLRADCSVLVRGTSGRGKTSITSYARNLTGDFTGWPPPAATAAFSATVTTVEDDASQIKHLPLTVDDLAVSDRMTPAEQAEKARILDMVLRSVGNNTAVRERMTRNMERQIPRKIDAVPVITAERLPDTLASALNRAVLLDIGESDVHKDAMKAESETHAAGLRGVGYGLIAWIARQWDERGDDLARQWADWHRETTRQIERDVIAARHGRGIPDNASRLPNNGAHLLLAAYVLDGYAAAVGIGNPLTPGALYPDLIAHLCAQIETIGSLETGGNDGQPLGEWICEQVRAALSRADAHVKHADGSSAVEGDEVQPPENLGYRPGPGGLDARGVYLGNVTSDGRAIAFDPHNLYELLKRAARSDRRSWTIGPADLGRALHRAGLAATGDGHHIARLVRIQGKQVRRLCIPCHLIWPDYDDGDGDGDGDGDTLAPIVRAAVEREEARERYVPDRLPATPSAPAGDMLDACEDGADVEPWPDDPAPWPDLDGDALGGSSDSEDAREDGRERRMI